MNAEKLAYIKDFQKKYFEKYGEKVIIDFVSMIGRGMKESIYEVPEIKQIEVFNAKDAEEFLRKVCEEHKVSYNKAISGRQFRKVKDNNYKIVLRKYALFCEKQGYSDTASADFIKKHRTTVLYYKDQTIKTKKKIQNVQNQRDFIEASGH